MRLQAEQIFTCAPNANAKLVGEMIDGWSVVEENGIVTPRQTAFFLGHCAVESRGFTRLDENLYYTTTARLRAVWPSRFKSDDTAANYLRSPAELANHVYGSRLGNQDDGTADNDGWDYRGSGFIQTTGKANFAAFEKATKIGVVKQPELLRTMPHALEAAAVFWRINKLNDLVDGPDAIAATTKRIQGGDGGLADRTIYINRFMARLATTGGNMTLRRGSKGAAVQAIQMTLRALGHYGGKIDGDYGPGTENAVREFQESRSLHPIDGVAGPITLAALE
jgi:putative chitinase